MTEAVKMLFEEHEQIISALDLIRDLDPLPDQDPARYEQVAKKLLVFFREYADAYHHAKEEDILFPEMNHKNELLQDGIIHEMLENHKDMREMLSSVENFLQKKDYRHAQQQFNLYTEALLDHIAVENDEVFQVAEGLLSEDEMQKVYFRFLDSDRALGQERKESLAGSLHELNKLIRVQ